MEHISATPKLRPLVTLNLRLSESTDTKRMLHRNFEILWGTQKYETLVRVKDLNDTAAVLNCHVCSPEEYFDKDKH